MQSIPQKMIGMITNPIETYRTIGEESLSSTLVYFVVILAIYTVLALIAGMIWSVVLGLFTGGAALLGGFAGMVIGIFTTPIFAIITMVILIVLLHLAARLLGGTGDLNETVRVIVYGATPSYLLGWIPVIGFLFWLWSFVLFVFGLEERHRMDRSRAAIASLVVLAICVVFYVLVIVLAIAAGAFAVSQLFNLGSSGYSGY